MYSYHLRTIHSDFHCNSCGVGFKNNTTLESHECVEFTVHPILGGCEEEEYDIEFEDDYQEIPVIAEI